ncbi:MAG: FAD-binding protein [Deltaproteobacteria bacterium]|nr:FAD-binding protein [Deltaproteobacteria bacterium]
MTCREAEPKAFCLKWQEKRRDRAGINLEEEGILHMDLVKTDVLVIGGGIAGCFAALRASELGRDVLIMEKASLRRGGAVGPGMDHINMGIWPKGMLTLDYAKKKAALSKKDLLDPNVVLAVDKGAYARIQDLERFGVPVREDDGSYRVWEIPERRYSFVSYRGRDTKVKLAEAVRKTNTTIVERTMAVDLLVHEGRAAGAVGLNVRDGHLTAFLANATIVCTGDSGRQYLEPDGLFLTYEPITNTGDAQAIGYRSGAKLANMEYIYMDYVSVRAGGGIAGIKPFEKMGILVNRKGEKVLQDEKDSVQRAFLMVKEIAEGRGPLYWDFRHLPEEVLAAYEREMEHEYPITKEWFKQKGLDLRKDLIPVQLVPAAITGGLLIDETFTTSLEGLYAAGSSCVYLLGLAQAAVSGHIAGESAASYVAHSGDLRPDEGQISEIEKHVQGYAGRKKGIDPISLEEAVRSISTDYVGYFKEEWMMRHGLEKLLELREQYLSRLVARNPHELMRCLEVRNIFDMIEMHIRASLMRTETRLRKNGLWPHYRIDYPELDPEWEKLVVIQKKGEEMGLSTHEIPDLKED